MTAINQFWDECDEVSRMMSTIDYAAAEPHLVRILRLCQEHPECREHFVNALIMVMENPRKWSDMVAAFSMRTLQWPEIKEYCFKRLEREEYRFQDMTARHVLHVYQDKWPPGGMFDFYASELT